MITVTTLKKMKENNDKITMLTCYDASFAKVMNKADVDVLLVGDSLGMTIQGHASTLPVTMEHMIYHTQNVANGNQKSLIVSDLPFGAYEGSVESAYMNAVQLMKAGAHMVKIEGGQDQVEKTAYLSKRSIPVCAHLGLTPQSVNTLGGYRVQGRHEDVALEMVEAAIAHELAGAAMIVLECIPQELAKKIAKKLHIPVIGIGAGIHCDGQVLVLQDMLGIYPNPPSFSKNFLIENNSIEGAIQSYVKAVKMLEFPTDEQSFN